MSKFEVIYHGLFDRMKISEVDSEKVAQDICLQHNKSVPDHWFSVGLDICHIEKYNLVP